MILGIFKPNRLGFRGRSFPTHPCSSIGGHHLQKLPPPMYIQDIRSRRSSVSSSDILINTLHSNHIKFKNLKNNSNIRSTRFLKPSHVRECSDTCTGVSSLLPIRRNLNGCNIFCFNVSLCGSAPSDVFRKNVSIRNSLHEPKFLGYHL